MTRSTNIKNIDRLFSRDGDGGPLSLIPDHRRFARAYRDKGQSEGIRRHASSVARLTVRIIRRNQKSK